MAVRVGIPRSLLYYYYGDIWREFFRRLGADVVVSGETSQSTIEQGGLVDEVCLPLKVAAGHACELKGKVDYIFLPRIVSLAAGQYTCPQIIGLPDVVRSCYRKLPPLIDVTVNQRRNSFDLYRSVIAIGRVLKKNAAASTFAWLQAARLPANAAPLEQVSPAAQLRIALIGHPYLIYDRQISMDVIRRLTAWGVEVVTANSVDPLTADYTTRRLAKKIFWQFCNHLTGAALALMYSLQPLDGLIFLTSFACGPDSLVSETLRWHARHHDIPFLLLTVDEHTAEAGFVTRLEAFTDMLGRRDGG